MIRWGSEHDDCAAGDIRSPVWLSRVSSFQSLMVWKLLYVGDGVSHADGVRLREEPFDRWYVGTF
jgi:hypothetical protein